MAIIKAGRWMGFFVFATFAFLFLVGGSSGIDEDFETDSIVIVGKVYDSDFSEAISDTSLALNCGAKSFSTKSLYDGTYGGGFDKSECMDGSEVKVKAIKDNLEAENSFVVSCGVDCKSKLYVVNLGLNASKQPEVIVSGDNSGNSGGSSGGGSFISRKKEGNVSAESKGSAACVEDWECGEWIGCVDGIEKRTCADNNSCGTFNNRPEEERECSAEKSEEGERLFSKILGAVIGTGGKINPFWAAAFIVLIVVVSVIVSVRRRRVEG